MNETLKAISERYSCRDFADVPLTDEQIEALVGAALAAPSGMNSQPWHVTVVTNKALIEELDADGVATLAAAEDKTFYERVISRGGKMLYNAPCLIVITADGSKWSSVDSGILCQNVTLAAQSMGLGSCIVGMLTIPLNSPRGDEFKKRLGFPDGYEFVISVLAGTVSSGKEPHDRDYGKVTYIK